jgi:integrase
VDHALVPAPGAPLRAVSEDRYATLIDPQNAPITPAEAESIRANLDESEALNTRRAHRSDWADFTSWCVERGLASLPADPQTVARYASDLAERGRKVATITRRLSSISQAHQAQELDSPTRTLLVRKVMAGIRRRKGVAQIGKAPVLPDDLRQMLRHLDDRPAGLRDRALLLLGFAGAFRRSEVVSLDVADVQFRREGLVVTLRRSKTDQEGEGTVKGIPAGRRPETCPVKALKAWLAAAAIEEGPLFRPIDRHGNIKPQRLADYHVARLVKRLAEAAGLDPAAYSGHSLRAGLATAAAQAGADERAIMKQTGHRSERMVRRYIRDGQLFRDNAAGDVGL